MSLPERTCIGCRRRGVKSELLRLVRATSPHPGGVAVDPRQSEPGRGAYLHHDPGCVELAERRRAVARALRTSQRDATGLAEVVAPHLGGGGRTT